ncbi:DNA phosphorothioation-associated DGQHR protein 1 [Aureimonas jatrophae]|uniref:DNA phosphorothioation-associated DGQHR protein 1 n=1 Tax=Aureimonas jatrophae TaxID=1166073 RepID=A0A1H0N014_9HYPH|nr:DNA phosphorothioation-associated DGQHR protein 1 [Aureimonas jatrophae]MBB3952979.1 DNA phosphorothioation-associated DGQHR protein 1 [Aureimonas jatrophae]SDO86079.1 DNA phosphorothioation-associated DGQHR protein 1 [Aureimonas jatrophae]
MTATYPFKTKALQVVQPLDTYYVAVIPANILLDVAFSDRLRAREDDRDGYRVEGTQRARSGARQPQIEDYIGRTDSAFPNSIILAANYDAETGHLRTQEPPVDDGEEQPETIWTIDDLGSGCFELTIPTAEKLAGIIDGQHRLDGFRNVPNQSRKEMDLICSVFMELSKPYQAQLFATINSTQKQVDKSLTYELFGYNIEEEAEDKWSPDKLAVFLTRRLNTQKESPLRGRISISPRRDQALSDLNASRDWHVSTATIVEGILRLISANPKRDTNAMLTSRIGTRSILKDGSRDRTPMRSIYINGNDAVLYGVVLNFLKACDECFWQKASPSSFITKTVGIQALFDILRKLAPSVVEERKGKVSQFVEILDPASRINFSSVEFKNASGSGRSMIRRAIEEAIF